MDDCRYELTIDYGRMHPSTSDRAFLLRVLRYLSGLLSLTVNNINMDEE